MFGIGLQELVVIFLIILFVFGAKRLPEIANSLGRAIREFKKSSKEDQPNDANIDLTKTAPPSEKTDQQKK
jgi:TatA/E family protein of Tat protein translocase